MTTLLISQVTKACWRQDKLRPNHLDESIPWSRAAKFTRHVGTKDKLRSSHPDESIPWSRVTKVTHEVQAPRSPGIMADRACRRLALIGMLTPGSTTRPWKVGNSRPWFIAPNVGEVNVASIFEKTYRNLGAVGLSSSLTHEAACRPGSKVFQLPCESRSLGNREILIEKLPWHQA
jgi:hypothetical protein